MICPLMCTVYYFLICHYEYQYLNLFKGQEVEIFFSLFSVYFGVGAMTLWGSFYYLTEEESGLPQQYVQSRVCFICSGCPRMSPVHGSPLGISVVWAHAEASCAAAVSCYFFTNELKMDSFWGMKGSLHWPWDMKPSLP